MRFKLLFTILTVCSVQLLNAQLYINSAQLTIQAGASVVVQGDVTSNTDILGAGKLVLKGSSNQNVSMSGFTIPNLEMDNTANATLTSNARIGTSMLFTNGKILAGNYNLNLAPAETNTGMGTSKFVETNGTGQVMQELTANVTSKEIPVGVGTSYRPAFLTTSATYSSATTGIKVLAVSDPSKPPMISDYLTAYWPVTRTGVTGTVTVAGQYIDAGDIVGTEANLRGYFYNGTDWNSTSGTNDVALNRVGAPVTGTGGDVYGMDKFLAVGARALLQGPYVAGTGMMSDGLRSPTNSIPSSDPYRTLPYSGYFTHVANATTETLIGTPLADQGTAANNIVDWVFLELRNTNASPGNVVVQTRAALIQRDGDIVDVDGVSPVTFNNIANGSYGLTIRHRNHLGLSINPNTAPIAMNETKSTAYTTNVVDMRSITQANLFGTSSAHTAIDGYNIMWSGSVNSDNKVKYSGLTNDPQTILNNVLAFPANTTGAYNYNAAFGYFEGDVNMDRKVKYSGLGNDAQPILNNVLAYPGNTTGAYNYNAMVQQIPN
jgi:hypothetical protein